MPTTKPRIGLTVSDDLFELIMDVADETNRSMSGLVAEMIEDQRETLEAIRNTYADEQKLKHELCQRFGERAGMTFRELQELAARPTSRRQTRAA